ncbi:hypothetical protein PQX77_011521 [Marasmius sp. AFHP31]|nr:hypothetical protein PQX77_011521 [Marasmius sp. AFHP31]
MQDTHSCWGPHHSSDRGAYPNLNHGRDQNINNQGYQNINSGGQIGRVTGGAVNQNNADLINIFNNTIPPPYPSLWDPIIGVGASHNAEQQFERGGCLPGTRVEAIREIHDWRSSREEDRPICWLSGAVGVGKSAIAMTVAQECEKASALVSSFFFFRSDPNRNNPSALWFTIAHGLALSTEVMRSVIEDRIITNPTIRDASLEHQFREIILNPAPTWDWPGGLWGFYKDLADMSPLPSVIIIDGLDECGNEETQLRILTIIQSAFQQVPHLPLRFLICSRPESWIQEAFSDEPLLQLTKTTILEDSLQARGDIRRYYLYHFNKIAASRKYGQVQFPDPWPSERDLETLVERSCSQFVYAVTVILFVKLAFNHPILQLHIILENTSPRHPATSPYSMLDALYDYILAANPYREDLLRVLAAILVLPANLVLPAYLTPSPKHLELLLDWPSGQVDLTLRAMHSVLNIRSSVDGVDLYHTSFRDYLLDRSRSHCFHIDINTQKHAIAQQWLRNLSTGKIRTYSNNQLYGEGTTAFFTQWIRFSTSFTELPQCLLDDLQNVDLAATYLVMRHRHNSQRTWAQTFWDLQVRLAFRSRNENNIIEHNMQKYQALPEGFHLEWSPGISPRLDITDWLVRITTGCDRVPLPVPPSTIAELPRLVDCHCNLARGLDSCDPGHVAYQKACVEFVKSRIFRFEQLLRDSTTSMIFFNLLELHQIFQDMLQSSVLKHCRLDVELLSLCRNFLELAQGGPVDLFRFSHAPKGEKDIIEWIEVSNAFPN